MNRRQYLGHLMTLFTGTGLAQVINFAAYPILTRTYTSDHFGLFSIFMAATAIVGILACGRFDAVIQVSRFSERFAVFRLAILIAAGTASVSAVGYFVAAGQYGGEGAFIALLAGLTIFLIGYTFAASAFLLKHEKYHLYSTLVVVRTLLTAIPQVILFFLLPSELGLIIGFSFGLAAQALAMAWAIRRQLPMRPATNDRFRAILRRYRRYAWFDVPSTLLAVLALYVPNFFILLLFSATEVGWFGLAFRLAGLPMAVFADSLAQVFFQKAAKSHDAGGTFWLEFRLNFALALAVALAIVAGILLLVRPVILFYLGDGWEAVADVLVCISPMIGLRFVSATIAPSPLIIRKPHWLLINNAALLLAFSASFAAAWALELDLFAYLWLTSGLVASVYLAFVTWITLTVYRRYREDRNG